MDAGNAAGWLPNLRAAVDQGPEAVDAVLRSMATATSFNLYFNRVVTDIADAFARAHISSGSRPGKPAGPFERMAYAAGTAAARAVPALQSVTHACADPARRATRAEPCRAILQVTASADTVLIASLGARLRVRLEAPEDPDRVAAESWRRIYEWQRTQSMALEYSIWHVDARAETRLKLMASLPRDQDVMIAMLEKYGRPVEPPADWQPATSP